MKIQSLKAAIAVAMALSFTTANAKDIVFKSSAERAAAIKSARVWTAPEWISADFKFSDNLDVFNGPTPQAPYDLLLKPEVFCKTTEEDQKIDGTGKTPKFYCQLMESVNGAEPTVLTKASGKTYKIKAKYPYANGKVNNEIHGEVMGTRLLWALGFGADRMFFVEKTHCYGCSEDPFKTHVVDKSTLVLPRTFAPTAIEVKLDGSKMISGTVEKPVEGFLFNEIMSNLPDDAAQKSEQFAQRDALRLMAIFLQHLDMKPENQKIICPADPDENGNCPVQPILYIQDIGSSFGVKEGGFFSIEKVNLNVWSAPFWVDPAKCQAAFDRSRLKDKQMRNPIISESGRKFLANLLDGFSAGEAGRKRVEDLFRAARIDQRGRGETIEMWRDAFLAKVQQLKNPMGEQNPNFTCPQ